VKGTAGILTVVLVGANGLSRRLTQIAKRAGSGLVTRAELAPVQPMRWRPRVTEAPPTSRPDE